jgi:phage-related protein
MSQYIKFRKKKVIYDARAYKELIKLPHEVQDKFLGLITALRQNGKLNEPEARKLMGHKGLYEIRINYNGAWRSIYAYIDENKIIILVFFQKKARKTPRRYIKNAVNRLNKYA